MNLCLPLHRATARVRVRGRFEPDVYDQAMPSKNIMQPKGVMYSGNDNDVQ